MKARLILSLRTLCLVSLLSLSSTAFAERPESPTGVGIDGNVLSWNPVDGAGGYNIYNDSGYLTTVRDRTTFRIEVDGFYQVVAFDESASEFSRLSEGVAYEAGVSPSVSADINAYVNVRSVTCRNLAQGASCAVSCGGPGEFNVATGGACAGSSTLGLDAVAGVTSYSCTAPNPTTEVTAQVYCLSTRAFGQ